MTKTITVTSGKGGVGKTNLVVNMAMQLAALDYRTCVFDADLGLANINIVCGLYPEHTVEDVVLRDKSLSDIIIKNYHGIDVIPGSSGVEKIANLDSAQLSTLVSSFSILDQYDYLFFDTAAGVSKNVISFCLSSSEIICIITPEPTSLTDAYALLKILYLNGVKGPVKIVVNQCKNTTIARQTYTRFKDVVQKYLNIDIQALGVVLTDPHISESVGKQRPFISLYPNTVATKCIKSIANNLQGKKGATFSGRSVGEFWTSFVRHFTSRLNLSSAPSASREKSSGSKAAAAPAAESDKTAEAGAQAPVTLTPAPGAATAAGQEAPGAPGNQDAASAESQAAAVQQQPITDTSSGSETSAPDVHAAAQHTGIRSTQSEPGSQKQAMPAGLDASHVYPLMESLASSLTSISEDISALRASIQENGHGLSSAKQNSGGPADSDRHPHIPLDFDKYVENRNRAK